MLLNQMSSSLFRSHYDHFVTNFMFHFRSILVFYSKSKLKHMRIRNEKVAYEGKRMSSLIHTNCFAAIHYSLIQTDGKSFFRYPRRDCSYIVPNKWNYGNVCVRKVAKLMANSSLSNHFRWVLSLNLKHRKQHYAV